MKCFQCGNQLGSSDMCLTCGQDVRLYKKILRTSNLYYNIGLEKAKVRDLSGAVAYLKKSLAFNKRNTDARNLLGLIYFEMGEAADALAEWVISKNMQPEENLAGVYLDAVQASSGRLEQLKMTIRKYNQAVHYAGHDSADLALLQLKKVISMNPRYIRAYLLLALLYMKNGEYGKAEKLLRKVLTVDVSNRTALSYMAELKKIAKERKKSSEKRGKPQKETAGSGDIMRGEDVIIPTYRDMTGSWQTVLLLLMGIAIGVLCTYFLIFPSQRREMNQIYNTAAASYNEKLALKDVEISALENEKETLNGTIADLETELKAYKGEGGIMEEYGQLLTVMAELRANNYLAALNAFLQVDASLVSDATFQNYYDSVKTEFDANAVKVCYETGHNAYNSGDYESAKNYLSKCLELQPEYPDAIYWLGMTYISLGDKTTADTYFRQMTERFPDHALTAYAKAYLG